MGKQGKAFGFLLLSVFFWFWVMGTALFGVHFLFTGDAFSLLVFAVGAVFTLIYSMLLKRSRTLRDATNEFIDQAPPIG